MTRDVTKRFNVDQFTYCRSVKTFVAEASELGDRSGNAIILTNPRTRRSVRFELTGVRYDPNGEEAIADLYKSVTQGYLDLHLEIVND